MRSHPPALLAAILTLTAAFGIACAHPSPELPIAVTTFEAADTSLETQGPGAVFPSVETAAVDALTYAYLQARAEGNAELMRAGSIYATRGGYSYGEIHVAKPLAAYRVSYTLEPRDVARFLIYPRDPRHDVNRANERPSMVERRSVTVTDPLHRPLYILHPSLAIREYRGEDHLLTEVANLRRPSRVPRFLAEN
ncbi:MAG TPA: hypothetical protein VIY27_13585 [Myxococcota bacterium]